MNGIREIPALEALNRLREGNKRFVSGERISDALTSRVNLKELATGQEPFAVVLGCSDARVPAEIVFDQGLGDLFVIRVAGNIVAPSTVGSVEFAAERTAARLVVVMGHTMCGAIEATLEEIARPGENQSPNLRAIVNRIRPSIETLLVAESGRDKESLMQEAVRANICASVDHLKQGSEILKHLIRNEDLLIVGAEYSLETGMVDFFEGVPDRAPAQL